MQSLRLLIAGEEKNVAEKEQEKVPVDFSDIPKEILAKIMSRLSMSEISKLFRTNRVFFAMKASGYFFLEWRSNVNKLLNVDKQSNEIIEVIEQLESLAKEKQQNVSMIQIFQRMKLNKLNVAFNQAKEKNVFEIHASDYPRQAGGTDAYEKNRERIFWFGICCMCVFPVTVGAITTMSVGIPTGMSGMHGFLLFGGVSILSVFIAFGIFQIPVINQLRLNLEKNKVANELENSLKVSEATPLLKPIHGVSSAPIIEEVFDANDSEEEVELMEVVSSVSPVISESDDEKQERSFVSNFPDVPHDHAVTKRGSPTLYAGVGSSPDSGHDSGLYRDATPEVSNKPSADY